MSGRAAEVWLWGAQIGAVSWDAERAIGAFEYTPAFQGSGIEIAPLTMPLKPGTQPLIYRFPELARETFHGLPGLLADHLPDRFGHRVIDAWLAREGRSPADFSPVDRLLYIGRRAMGALEFRPPESRVRKAQPIDLAALVALANDILAEREDFSTELGLDEAEHREAMNDILQVGVSAGGARAKAIIAWNSRTNEIRSGQIDVPEGFEHWLLKFDGISHNRDREALADPQGYGLIEYAYYRMARAAGIEMSECRLLQENGRHHFMTRRFDRSENGGRLHMLSLCGMAHLDYNEAGAHGYEQAFQVIEQLGMGKDAIEEQFRRMAFNVLARNQDDHTRNIAFLMDRRGRWHLSPAFDLTLAYNPRGQWTHRHQMSINGKRDDFHRDDLLTVAERFRITRPRARDILRTVDDAIARWPEFGEEAGIDGDGIRQIGGLHRRLSG
ncbi:type II toxin-antitoxin system HipA family toxin [Natronospira bacteriovora]|uniref:Type II toxin-antitoxin system HipA family toxin n=1 Tax=Natronospira bacteriovora TaxID=3069753 RepID=A0ABU0W692_9GAMM|nr:type II toxin-antitoxin system HipA family toxin [Natronospira sp. AB-CW4]MDQ2068980.1 type II toxin-antitoxin system HipA family toxin [Natronospira sp. AB-CW4]